MSSYEVWTEIKLIYFFFQILQISCIEFIYIVINCNFSKIWNSDLWLYVFNLIKVFFAKELKNLHTKIIF